MKKTTKKYINKIASLAVLLALLAGCSEYFDNPLKDKETGEDINLLLVDFNFFTTRMTFKIYDATDSTLITSEAEFSFSGENADDIVNYAGEKNDSYETSQGQLELTIDPNVDFSSSSPFSFAVNVSVDGYNSLSKGIKMSTTGKKTYELYLVNKSDEDETDIDGGIDITGFSTSSFNSGYKVKSATANDYTTEYRLVASSYADIANMEYENGNADPFPDPNNVNVTSVTFTVSTYTNYSPGADVIYYDGALISASFHKLETGSLTSLKINGYKVTDLNGVKIKIRGTYTGDTSYDLFGFTEFDEDAWYFDSTPEDLKDSVIYETMDFNYTLAQASSEGLCETGSSIIFTSSAISSFSIDADAYNSDGEVISTINFKGSFPDTFLVENVPSEAVTLKFRDKNSSFQKISDLSIDNFCTGEYTVSVSPTSGYDEYQIVLKAICPDDPTVGIAPTYSAEIKISDSSDSWQGVDMEGGVVDMLLKTGEEYELRLLWEDEWEYASFATEFNSDGSYAGPDYSDTEISSKYIDNNSRIRVNVKKEFAQNICDDMGW